MKKQLLVFAAIVGTTLALETKTPPPQPERHQTKIVNVGDKFKLETQWYEKVRVYDTGIVYEQPEVEAVDSRRIHTFEALSPGKTKISVKCDCTMPRAYYVVVLEEDEQ